MRLISALILVSALLPSWFPRSTHRPGIDPAVAAKVFVEAKQCSDRDGGRLWGLPIYGPMMFVDVQTHEIATNRSAPGSDLKEVDGAYVGHLPESVGIANAAVEWAGVRWSMIMWPLPEREYPRERLLMHESFHRIQPQLKLQSGNPANAHLETEQGRVWLRLEWRALKAALAAKSNDRQAAIRDALIFREYRRQLFPTASTGERALEMNEGLAEYTGVKLAASSLDFAEKAAIDMIENTDSASSFARSFAYTSGPAYGLLLDCAGVDWRRELNPASDLGALLRDSYHLQLPDDLKSAATKQKARYDGDKVIAEERSKAEEHKKREEGYRAKLVDGPVLVLPATANVNYSFDPNDVFQIDDYNAVYPTLTVIEEWGHLDVAGGALMVRNEHGIERFQVKAPVELKSSPLAGDGWTLKLAPGWEVVSGARNGDYIVVKTR